MALLISKNISFEHVTTLLISKAISVEHVATSKSGKVNILAH